MQDIIDRLAVELDHAPEAGFDVASTVASGRSVVRRRRIAAGGVVLTAALVVGGTAWAIAPGNDTKPDAGNVAVEPPSDTTSMTGSAEPAVRAEPLVELPDGTTGINPDAEVLEESEYTAESGATVATYHLRLSDGGEFYAYVGNNNAGSFPAPAQGLTLREWAKQTLDGSSIADDGWVRFDNGSHLTVVLEGLSIVKQLPDPGLGDSFAAPGEPTALAEVLLDGTTYYLAVRATSGGPTEAIPYRRDDTVTSIQQFRTFAMNQYAENETGGSEGLR